MQVSKVNEFGKVRLGKPEDWEMGSQKPARVRAKEEKPERKVWSSRKIRKVVVTPHAGTVAVQDCRGTQRAGAGKENLDAWVPGARPKGPLDRG